MKRILPLLLVGFLCNAQAGAVFGAASYTADVVFHDALTQSTMTMAYAGNTYYSSSGGSGNGLRLARYTNAGAVTNTYAAGLDFRSVFASNSGDLLARAYNGRTIYKQASAGVFSSMLTLSGGTIDAQANVDMNDAGQFVSQSNGLVNVWSATGAFVNSFRLNGFVSGSYGNTRGIVAASDYLFTYDNNKLSAWSYTGTLLDSALLNTPGNSFSTYSLSYANDRVFIADSSATWRGYDIGLGAATVPEPSSLALIGLVLAGLTVSRSRRKAH